MLLLLLFVLFGNAQVMTGDEPRYLLYAMSFIRHGSFVMPLSEWNRISMRAAHYAFASLPAGGGGVVVMNGVYLPVLLSPLAGLFSLAGLRAATLLAGVVGLWFLFRLLQRVAGSTAAILALFVTAFSLPLLPYLHLFYMETFLFALVSCCWERLQRMDRGFWGDLLTGGLLVLVPFVHMRGSVVAAALFLMLLIQLVQRRRWGRIGLLVLLASAVGLTFIVLNLRIYGAITGPVNTARPPSPAEWFAVISMQLFNVRHGLFTYAPVWIAGYAGLLWALLPARSIGSAHTILRQASLLATVAAVTGVGVNPGECWPARFWVLSVPMLAVGFAYMLHRIRGVLPVSCLAVLLAVTAANTAVFVSYPNKFIEDRQTSATYDGFFERYGHLDPSLILPVETGTPANTAAATRLTLVAASLTVLLALSLRWRWAGLPALLLLAGTMDTARARRISPAAYIVEATPSQLVVTLRTPLQQPVVQFGHDYETWFTPESPEMFDVRSVDGGSGSVSTQPANQIVTVKCTADAVRNITIEGMGVSLEAESNARFWLVQPRSFLRRLWLSNGC